MSLVVIVKGLLTRNTYENWVILSFMVPVEVLKDSCVLKDYMKLTALLCALGKNKSSN